jgi:hypothetical protein
VRDAATEACQRRSITRLTAPAHARTIVDVRRRTIVSLVVVAASLILVAGTVSIGSALGLFQKQIPVTVVNDSDHRVDLTCLWDNRDGLRPGKRITLPVDAESVEHCELDGTSDGADYGCLVVDARGSFAVPHEVRVTSARDTDTFDCLV